MTAQEVAYKIAAHTGKPVKKSGTGYSTCCPAHEDSSPSLSISDARNGGVLLKCFAGCTFDQIVSSAGIVALELAPPRGLTPNGNGSKKIVATYPYTDEDGDLLFEMVRFAPKGFSQRRPDGNGGWEWNLEGTRRVLYNLPAVLQTVKDGRWIIVVEGEKDAHALIRLGIVAATCNPGGACKWRPEYSEFLRGAKVCIVPDQDAPGEEHGRQVAGALHGVAAALKVLDLPGLTGEKGNKDVSDWLAQGNDAAAFKRAVLEAPLWEPPEPEPVQDAIPAEPSPQILPAAELLERVSALLERFVIFPNEHQVVALSLWAMHTHVFEAFETTPYIAVGSPTKQAGKSRLFEVLALLVARAWSAVVPSQAVLFRKISDVRPTLLLDEVDAQFGADPTLTEGIRAILNAGYRKGAVVSRCAGPKNNELVDFAVYGPKAFAGIGQKLPDTIADRSIPIQLRRRGPNERQPDRLREVTKRTDLLPVGKLLQAWAADVITTLAEMRPDLPEELTDRQQDAWEPLLAIADLAGDEWPERARRAALALHGEATDQDLGILLLGHCRDAFGEDDTIGTAGLLATLVNREDDSPWARWWGDDVDRERTKGPGSKLAKMLKPYGIAPKVVWVESKTERGYKRVDFEDAWLRYGIEPTSLQTENVRTKESRSEADFEQKPRSTKSAPDQEPYILTSFPEGKRENGEAGAISRRPIDVSPSRVAHGPARMALARYNAGQPLTPEDERALRDAGISA